MAPRFKVPVVEAQYLALEVIANRALFTRDLVHKRGLQKASFLNLPHPQYPLMSGAMALEEILVATPPGTDPNDFPSFVLEDAIAVYEDGTPVNLLAQHGDRKIYIRGRLVRDDGDEDDDAGNGSWFIKYPDPKNPGKTKDCSGEYINEEFLGEISHSTGHITLWVSIQRKWFELKPSAEYTLIFNTMFNVVGIFWTNLKFVEEGGQRDFISAPRDSSEYGHLAFMYIVASYQKTDHGASFTLPELLENIDECGDWLRTECLNNEDTRLNKSPLFMWLQAAEGTKAATEKLGDEICDMVRDMDIGTEELSPDDISMLTGKNKDQGYYKSTAYPNGYQRFSTIGRLVNILAMHALEKRNPRVLRTELTLSRIALYLEREFKILWRPAALAFLQNKRLEILPDLSAELRDTPLYRDLETDPGPNFPRFSGPYKAAHKAMYEDLVSGRMRIVRRDYNAEEAETQNYSASLVTAKDGARVDLGGANYEDTVRVFHGSSSVYNGPRPNRGPDINSKPIPVRVGVPVHKHLAHLTSYGDGSINSSAEAHNDSNKQNPFPNAKPRIKRGYGDAY